MQQARFSPGPGSCPAWALPRVMALVRVLFCLCLDTFAKISERGEGSGQFRSPHSLCSCACISCPFLRGGVPLQGGFAERKWSSCPFDLTCVGKDRDAAP